jgi:hypothetical protein
MLFEGVLVALLIGLVAGGRMRNIDRLDFRAPGFLVAAFVLQAVLVAVPVGRAPWLAAAAPFLVVASYLLLLYGMARNWHLWGFRIALVGAALNFLVVVANSGYMPTSVPALHAIGRGDLAGLLESSEYGKNAVLTPHTRLPFLADVHPLPRPYPRPCVYSIGDILITVGLVLFVWQAVGAFGWRPRRRDEEAVSGSPAR